VIEVIVAPASLAVFFLSVAATLPIYAAACWLVALSPLKPALVLEHMARVLPFMRRFKSERIPPVSLPERRRLPCF
jgi:hypothetical protein